MELDEFKQVWGEQARKLDQVLSLNLKAFKTQQLDKTRSALSRFKMFIFFELVIGVALLLWSGSYLADHFFIPTLSVPAFVFAASMLVGVIGAIRKIVLLGAIDYADPVTVIQKKVESVKLTFLATARLMVLMLPLYMVYVVLGMNLLFGWDILAQGDRAFLWANLIFSLILVGPAIWTFRRLGLAETSNPIIGALVHGSGGKEMIAALEFLKALQEFEAEGEKATEEHR